MKLLKTIGDQHMHYASTREAVRAVLLDERQMIPLLYVARHRYHKLPGGGIDDGESREVALERELLERELRF